MPDVSFDNPCFVCPLGALAPLALGFCPRLRLPAVVLGIVLGVVVGPSVLGWVEADLPVQVLTLFGLSFLLFLSGLEIDPMRLHGRLLRVALLGYLVTLAIGVPVGIGLDAAGWVSDPLLVVIALSATSLGLVVPVLKDGGTAEGEVGQTAIVAATVADFAAIVLLSLLFSPSALLRVPVFLAALLVMRGVPALLYVRTIGPRPALAAGLLQATSLPFIVAASMIGVELGAVSAVTAATMVSAGLLSVLAFPALALGLIRGRTRQPADDGMPRVDPEGDVPEQPGPDAAPLPV